MKSFQQKVQQQFDKMCKTGKLFRVKMTGSQVWDAYLQSFGKDPKFRDPDSSVHNCNLCNNFIRRYGNIVALDENFNLMSIFDVIIEGEYENTAKELSQKIKASSIENVFFETFDELNSLPYESCKKTNSVFRLGIDKNHKRYTKEEAEKFGVVKPDEIVTFEHLFLDLPKEYVDMSGASVEQLMGSYRDAKNVFQRAMQEIPMDTLMLVKDLINQDSLLDGRTHLFKVEQFIPYKAQYDALSADKRENWCWVTSYKLPIAKFKNELIGVLCTELAEGKELNEACKAWNIRVDPVNYMKATAPITKKQIEEARKFVEENGYVESFDRRMATISDIRASEILHIAAESKIKATSMFDGVKSTSTRHKRSEFKDIEEINIDKFMKDILPSCTSVEVFLQNNHERNMVTLTTANVKESKPIMKWSNNYSWTYNGNLAGKSEIKEAVKTKGGNIDGFLRFSMIWNETGQDTSDLDAWCKQPNGESIGYSAGFRKDHGNRFSKYGGQLDLDNTYPHGLAVENIYFKDRNLLKDGKYEFWVNQFSARNSQGFKAEIEVNGEIYNYSYDRRVSGNVKVANVTIKDGVFQVEHLLPETSSSKEIYGLDTNQFHKVNLVCLSPNHWQDNVGNKHYFFMIEGCESPISIRSFHNENLIPELAQHRKVLEVLGATNTIESTKGQLSGLGFNATVRDELIVKLQGSFKRTVKIKF